MSSSFGISLGIHALLLSLFLVIALRESRPKKQDLSFTVVENFKVAEEKINLPPPKPIAPEVKKPAPAPKEQVYGLNKKSITSNQGEIAVKAGNTIAKAVDDKILTDEDADSIPIPADEFLVTSMPAVLEEIRPIYPESARKEGVEGTVVLEIIIDQEGRVRKVEVLKSLGEELDNAAIKAIEQFKFRPAQINDEKVAVKINYGIKFILEI